MSLPLSEEERPLVIIRCRRHFPSRLQLVPQDIRLVPVGVVLVHTPFPKPTEPGP